METFGQFSLTKYLDATLSTIEQSVKDESFCTSVLRAAELCVTAMRAGGKVLLAGNGGSAGDAQHIAGEFISRFLFDRPAMPAIALTVDTSVLTAIGNDYGYEHVFSRQVQGLGAPGDVFIGISTSGRSPNILRAMDVAKEKGLKVIAFTGSKGAAMIAKADAAIVASSSETPYIQQVHIIAGHAICAAVEAAIFEPPQV
ncbi:D-sedoheptulose 7-phosphate isomerase [Roseiarcaceae bacterium H3SJ34-1]|uniref:D-sedoheptulose 7-phosphate isomerase n=1 Tax=Terripilifer ovatus TaxID=3032367 RepID=UPI003AB998AF|nr:D-sedoheptulose 7-phosphate isomerase [Roseiarcaceae bacterium H3SJ34-1]